MTQIKEKPGICKSVVIATVFAVRDVVKNGFHCTYSTEAELKTRIGKVRVAFRNLSNVLGSS